MNRRAYTGRFGAYGVARSAHGLIAAVADDDGRPYFPGGGVLPGESAASALERETREECGWTVAVGDLLGRAFQLMPDATGDRIATFTDLTHHSEKAFRFGLRTGSASGSTRPDAMMARNDRVNLVPNPGRLDLAGRKAGRLSFLTAQRESSGYLLNQRFGRLQIRGVEAFRELTIGRPQQS